jgi:tetratricopeptide (TPR) repeat protein
MAALSLIEGAGDSFYLVWKPIPGDFVKHDLLFDHLSHIDGRLTSNSWIRLSRAIAHERETYPDPRASDFKATEAEMKSAYEELQFARTYHLMLAEWPAEKVIAAREYGRRLKVIAAAAEFAALRRDADVGLDATLRYGVLASRSHGNLDALAAFDIVAKDGDNFSRCVARFFAGSIYESEGRFAEALAQYKEAARTQSNVQSAQLRMAALLAGTGHLQAAQEAAEALLHQPALDDPVKSYGTGTFHLWPLRIGALRRALGVPGQ